MLFSEFFLIETVDELYSEVDSFRNDRLNKARFINPKTDKNWRTADRWKQLRSIVTHEVKVNGTDPKKIWVTFSDVSKLGQRMKINGGKSTPVGIFAFPANFAIKQKTALPFSDRPYMHVFKTKNPHIEVGSKKDSEDFRNMTQKLGLGTKSSGPNNQLQDHDEFIAKLNNLKYNYYSKAEAIDSSSALGEFLSEMTDKIIDQNVIDPAIFYNYLKPLLNIDPQDAIEAYKPASENKKQVTDDMKTYIGAISFRDDETGERYKKFEDIRDDLSVKATPEYKKEIEADPLQEDFEAATKIKKDERIPFIFIKYYFTGYKAMKLLRSWKIHHLLEDKESLKFLHEYINKLKELMQEYGKPVSPTGTTKKDYSKLPYMQRLTTLAKTYGLDLDKAVNEYQSIKPVANANQFLYRVSQNLAKQYAAKTAKSDWRTAWNRFARELGVTGFADTKNSSHIHTSEPTQGVFMDPEDITLIATIEQVSHYDKNDPTNRPLGKDWAFANKTGNHGRVSDVLSNQRKGHVLASMPGVSDKEKNYAAIQSRLSSLISDYSSYGSPIESQMGFNKLDRTLTLIIKLYKTFRLLKNAGKIEPYSSLNLATTFNVLKNIMAVSDPKYVELLKPKIDALQRLSSNEINTTPIYQRR